MLTSHIISPSSHESASTDRYQGHDHRVSCGNASWACSFTARLLSDIQTPSQRAVLMNCPAHLRELTGHSHSGIARACMRLRRLIRACWGLAPWYSPITAETSPAKGCRAVQHGLHDLVMRPPHSEMLQYLSLHSASTLAVLPDLIVRLLLYQPQPQAPSGPTKKSVPADAFVC